MNKAQDYVNAATTPDERVRRKNLMFGFLYGRPLGGIMKVQGLIGGIMKIYWNLSNKERAALTNDDMAAYEKIELMETGIVATMPPEYEPEPEITVPTHQIHKIVYDGCNTLNIYFRDLTQAEEAAAALRGGLLVYEDYHTKTRTTKMITDVSIGVEDVHDESDVAKIRKALIEAKDVKSRNAAARSKYQNACSKSEDALSKMRNDRYKCRDIMLQMTHIGEVWQDYLETCNGDRDVARKFLEKAYSVEDLEAAQEWGVL